MPRTKLKKAQFILIDIKERPTFWLPKYIFNYIIYMTNNKTSSQYEVIFQAAVCRILDTNTKLLLVVIYNY